MKRILLLACLLSVPALAQQPTRPAITGIAFARFYTTDPAGAQKFYGSTLGFERKEADDMWLYPVNHSQWIEVLTTPPPPQPNVRMAAVAFTTDDAAKLEQYLEAHNIKPDLPLKNGQFGVRDPEGNLVIFVQRNSEKLVATGLASPSATSTRIIHVGFIVTDRAKDIAVLRSMGGLSRQLRNVFLLQGFLIGASGTILGLILGYSFAWVAGKYQLIPLDPQVYAVPYVPFHPNALDGVWISLVAMGISLLATLVPARAAAKLLPVEILRFECLNHFPEFRHLAPHLHFKSSGMAC